MSWKLVPAPGGGTVYRPVESDAEYEAAARAYADGIRRHRNGQGPDVTLYSGFREVCNKFNCVSAEDLIRRF